MGELLRVRLGPVVPLAVLALVAFGLIRRALAWLVSTGRVCMSASRRSLWTDLGYVVLGPAMELLSRTLTVFAMVGCAVLVGRRVGPELLDGFGPVAKQPRWAIVVEMLVLSDFLYYWVHRLAHRVPALWRLHAVHHSTQHLRWSSALRAHPAEVYLHVLMAVPLFLIGFPVDAVTVVGPLTTVYAIVIHANVDVSARWLSYLFNSPRYHGWHHARDAKDGGVNFAGFFPVFDALFGTYKLPDRLPDAFGIDDAEMPETCAAQLAYPFRSLDNASDPSPDAIHRDVEIPAALRSQPLAGL